MTTNAADGSLNVTVVSGSTYTGIYAADGSLNVIAAPGGTYVGLYHPCGAFYVTPVTDNTFRSLMAPDGSMYVTNTGMPSKNQGQPVTVVSGTLFGPPPTGFYYPWIFF
jgi:hypothetical protein